jgi:hypothetical protein
MALAAAYSAAEPPKHRGTQPHPSLRLPTVQPRPGPRGFRHEAEPPGTLELTMDGRGTPERQAREQIDAALAQVG